MDEARDRWGWLAGPSAILLFGLGAALVGTATFLIFPQTRFTGLTLVTALQGVAIFGGMAAMALGVHLMGAETPHERDERLRKAVRGALAFGIAFGMLSLFRVPFAPLIAGVFTQSLAEGFRRACVWLAR